MLSRKTRFTPKGRNQTERAWVLVSGKSNMECRGGETHISEIVKKLGGGKSLNQSFLRIYIRKEV